MTDDAIKRARNILDQEQDAVAEKALDFLRARIEVRGPEDEEAWWGALEARDILADACARSKEAEDVWHKAFREAGIVR